MTVKEIYEYLLLENKSKSNLAFTVAMLPNQGITETYDDAIDGLRKAMRFNHYKNPYIYIIHHNLNPLSGVVPYKRVNKNNIYDISFEYANKVIYVLDENLNIKYINYLFNNTELAIQRLKKYLWIEKFNEGDKVSFTYKETKRKLFKKKEIKVLRSGIITNKSNSINDDIINWDPIMEIDNKRINLDIIENMVLEN